jgi:uncharacterized membrane protein
MDLFSGFVALLAFAAVVTVLFVLIRRGTRAMFGPRRRLEEEAAMGQLRYRLSRGEITAEEFEQAKRAIGD